jgi:hypothetical protein
MTLRKSKTHRKGDSVAVNELLDDLPFDAKEFGQAFVVDQELALLPKAVYRGS